VPAGGGHDELRVRSPHAGSPLYVHHREDEWLYAAAAEYRIEIRGPPGIPAAA